MRRAECSKEDAAFEVSVWHIDLLQKTETSMKTRLCSIRRVVNGHKGFLEFQVDR